LQTEDVVWPFVEKTIIFTHCGFDIMRRNGKLFAGDYIKGIESIAEYDGFLIHRSPNTTLWSLYHHLRYRKKIYKGAFGQFIKNKIIGIKPYFMFYHTWSNLTGNRTRYWHIVYESLRYDAGKVLKSILTEAGVRKIINRNIDRAVKFCQFENLQKLELQGFFYGRRAGKSLNKKALKFREGSMHTRFTIDEGKLIANEFSAIKKQLGINEL
jgi:hypothetical protein